MVQVATTQPLAVTTCNIDMESLISDPNRSIATLAITTLLKVFSFVPDTPFMLNGHPHTVAAVLPFPNGVMGGGVFPCLLRWVCQFGSNCFPKGSRKFHRRFFLLKARWSTGALEYPALIYVERNGIQTLIRRISRKKTSVVPSGPFQYFHALRRGASSASTGS